MDDSAIITTMKRLTIATHGANRRIFGLIQFCLPIDDWQEETDWATLVIEFFAKTSDGTLNSASLIYIAKYFNMSVGNAEATQEVIWHPKHTAKAIQPESASMNFSYQ